MKLYWMNKLIILGVMALMMFDAGIVIGVSNQEELNTQAKEIFLKLQTTFLNSFDAVPYLVINFILSIVLPFFVLGIYIGQQLTWIDPNTFHFWMDIFTALPIIIIVEYIGYRIYTIYHDIKKEKAEGKKWNWLRGYT